MARPLDDQPDRVIARRARAASGEVVEARARRQEEGEGPSAEDLDRFGGVTTTCRNCGATLHDDVAICWSCGEALGAAGSGARVAWWAAAAIGLVIVAMVLALVL